MSTATPQSTTEKPLDEILTPQDVEDEALRNDLVIKWFVILIGGLFASTLIEESPSLLHIKSGEYLVQNGILPPATDPFSATASDRRWVNLSWGYDLLAYGFYSVGGWTGSSVLKILLSLITFGFLAHISRPGMITLWGSLCAGAAVVACKTQMDASPDSITLLGMAVTLWIWHGWISGQNEKRLWLLIPVWVVWGNLDPRMFFGPMTMIVYGLGNLVGNQIGFKTERPLDWVTFWKTVGIGVLATGLNPFTYSVWLSPWSLYGTFYPQQELQAPASLLGWYQGAFGVLSNRYQIELGFIGMTGLVLGGVSLLTILFNLKRVDPGQILMLVAWAGLIVLRSHEMGAAAIVFAVLATLNGQCWYANQFRLTYSTGSLSLLFSRGGRAVVVIGLFALAFFTTTGMLRGLEPRIGLGISNNLRSLIQGFEKVYEGFPDSDRTFNFALSQGDVLIWIGRTPFIDSRIVLYSGSGEEDLMNLHRRVRLSIRNPLEEAQIKKAASVKEDVSDIGNVKLRDEVFAKYGLTSCAPRLTSSHGLPDYLTFLQLLSNPTEWSFGKLSGVTSTFYLKSQLDQDLAAYVKENGTKFIELAFRKEGPDVGDRAGWVQLPTFYETLIWSRDVDASADVLEAEHLIQLAQVDGRYPHFDLVYPAIRLCLKGLSENRNDTRAYTALGRAYRLLARYEAQLVYNRNNMLTEMRYFQSVASLNQAVIADPMNMDARQLLFYIFMESRKHDLALNQVRYLIPHLMQTARTNEDINLLDELNQTTRSIEREIQAFDEQLKKENVPEQEWFRLYMQKGYPGQALFALSKVPAEVQAVPRIQAQVALMMIETGALRPGDGSISNLEAAYMLMIQAEGESRRNGSDDWRLPRFYTMLANGEQRATEQILSPRANELSRDSMRLLMERLALVNDPSQAGSVYPIPATAFASANILRYPDEVSGYRLRVAVALLEAGLVKQAQQTLERLLEENPDFSERPIVAGYLGLLTGKPVDPYGPADTISWEFAPEEGAAVPESGTKNE